MKGNPRSLARRDPVWFVLFLVVVTGMFFTLIVALPLISVFASALGHGLAPAIQSLLDPDALSAIGLTCLVVAISVPLNIVFGISAAWVLTKFEFWGKEALASIIDLPFSISPVISGMVFVLLYGGHGWFAPWLRAANIEIIFTLTGLVLATTLVTLPFVARELIPLMQAQGSDEEAAAATLGAGAWRTFFFVTLPNIRWALMYGVLLCTARAMGEFGAVSVVSGHIRGETVTMPLHIEILYNDYNSVAAFAMAALLSFFALITLGVKSFLEARFADELAQAAGR